ncbi:hypothetical protein [Streptomyces sp. NPDC056549]
MGLVGLVGLVLRSQLPTWLRFEDDPDLVSTEDVVQGHLTANSAAFREG